VGGWARDGVTFFAEALHWNGKSWSSKPVPRPGGTKAGDATFLNDPVCVSPKNCWGVGYYGTIEPTQTSLNEILHWNCSKWASVKSVPDAAGTGAGAFNQLDGATCGSPGNCWAPGSYAISSGAKMNEALHWTGGKWHLVKTPNPGAALINDSSTLDAVRCPTASDCWAVGSAQRGNGVLQNEILHWNGKSGPSIGNTGTERARQSACSAAGNCSSGSGSEGPGVCSRTLTSSPFHFAGGR
jgi:hypothetical protein